MSENEQTESKDEITARQARFLDALLMGKGVTEAAELAKVPKTTAYCWMHNSQPFRKALSDAKNAMHQAVMTDMIDAQREAIATLRRLCDPSKPDAVAQTAAAKLLDLYLTLMQVDDGEPGKWPGAIIGA